MFCEIAEGGGILRMRARGELVFAAHPQFRPFIQALRNTECRQAQFDLAQITHMDMCGVGMILLVQDEAAKAGLALEFLNLPSALTQILAITGRSLDDRAQSLRLAA